MSRAWLACTCAALMACVSGEVAPPRTPAPLQPIAAWLARPPLELPVLWAPPPSPAQPELLRIEPARAAARLGETLVLRLAGARAADARCVLLGREAADPRAIEVASPAQPGVVDVLCGVPGLRAAAQVTFTDGQQLSVADPYAGGAALFKLRDTAAIGLEGALSELGASAHPAFPGVWDGPPDRVGISRWTVVDIQTGVNYYQVISRLRAHPALLAESYLPIAPAEPSPEGLVGPWARAQAMLAAVMRGQRVIACPRPVHTPYWILHDALRFAEDACALPVCAIERDPGPLDAYPAQWRLGWLSARDAGTGSVIDLWRDELIDDFFPRPLEATLVAAGLDGQGRASSHADGIAPDLYVGAPTPAAAALAEAQITRARTPARDRLAAERVRAAAERVTRDRPDLDPVAVRGALLAAADRPGGRAALATDAARELARAQPPGRCAADRDLPPRTARGGLLPLGPHPMLPASSGRSAAW